MTKRVSTPLLADAAMRAEFLFSASLASLGFVTTTHDKQVELARSFLLATAQYHQRLAEKTPFEQREKFAQTWFDARLTGEEFRKRFPALLEHVLTSLPAIVEHTKRLEHDWATVKDSPERKVARMRVAEAIVEHVAKNTMLIAQAIAGHADVLSFAIEYRDHINAAMRGSDATNHRILRRV